MTKYNIYCNKGSRQKDAVQFAVYCINNSIEMDKLSHTELSKLKYKYDKEHYVQNGWHPTLSDLESEEE